MKLYDQFLFVRSFCCLSQFESERDFKILTVDRGCLILVFCLCLFAVFEIGGEVNIFTWELSRLNILFTMYTLHCYYLVVVALAILFESLSNPRKKKIVFVTFF